MNRDTEAALRELGLAPGATPREVERARRALVLAWHPDRFQQNPARRVAAETRLRRVNAAYLTLAERGFDTGRPRTRHADRGHRRRAPTPAPGRAAADDRLVRRSSPGWRVGWWGAVFVLLTFAYVASNDGGGAGALTRSAAPTRFSDSLLRTSRDAMRGAGPDDPRGLRSSLGVEPVEGASRGRRASRPWEPSRRVAPAPRAAARLFTLGASREDVLAIQGEPRIASERRWEYGYSYVEFDASGGVIDWYDSRNEPLRARLLPSAPGRRPEFFTVGSTKDEVLRVQGSPRRFTDDRWEYGYSYVEFEGDRVVRWYDSRAHVLRARLVPSEDVEPPESFTVGSTKDEVLLVQGSPPRFTDRRWEYGYSYVEFDASGRVVDWYDSGQRPLRAVR